MADGEAHAEGVAGGGGSGAGGSSGSAGSGSAGGDGAAPGASSVPEKVRRARSTVELALREAGLEWESPSEGTYVVTLPGTRKLSTTVSLAVGRHSLSVNAFVVRCPDENHAAVHRWLLERNTRLYGVSYAVDKLGDIYLVGRLPLSAVTADEVDRLLGVVLENADGSFNTLLEMGFASAIRREYEWRTSRGESTRNLDAFTHLTGGTPGGGKGD